MFELMVENLKKSPKKTMVFTEGSEPRILEAADMLVKEGILTPCLIGDPSEIEEVATSLNISLNGMKIVNPLTYDRFDEMVTKMVELRKGKMTTEECEKACKNANYFGTMLVAMGEADGLLGGATYSTADTVRPALQIVKTKPGCKLVSSSFILFRSGLNGPEIYVAGDCAINIDPAADEIVEITRETANTARVFGIDPKVALLSYSTKGSGKGPSVDKMREATEKLQAMDLSFPVDGELQFDSAFSSAVAKTKAPKSDVAGQANTFIFPDINAGNIGYKMAQYLGGFEAYGPILQGLNAPINDLSRGCNAHEVFRMAIITAALG